ncbi:MAG: DUF4395 family protein [Actinomycetota bacterium]
MLSPAPAPTPIDPRGPRLNQLVLTIGLLAGGIADQRWVVPFFAVVLGLGAAFGPRYGPVLRFYAEVVRPRLGPPEEWEDPRPPRFAAAVGVVFLLAASVAFLAGAPGLAWALATVVAVLAGLAAVSGLCVGCEVWVLWARWRARPDAGVVDGELPIVVGRPTDVVFTTPWCANCEPALDALAEAGDDREVVVVDATRRPDLSRRYEIRSAPTVVRLDEHGDVVGRLVGLSEVRGATAPVSSA